MKVSLSRFPLLSILIQFLVNFVCLPLNTREPKKRFQYQLLLRSYCVIVVVYLFTFLSLNYHFYYYYLFCHNLITLTLPKTTGSFSDTQWATFKSGQQQKGFSMAKAPFTRHSSFFHYTFALIDIRRLNLTLSLAVISGRKLKQHENDDDYDKGWDG